MKKVRIITSAPHSKQSFLLGKLQTYTISPVGYINPNNPNVDTNFEPIDSTKIKITMEKEMETGESSFIIENESNAAVNIEIYEQE